MVTLLSLDISGVFNYISYERLVYNLRKRRVPLPIVTWVQSFVSNRKTTIRVAEGEL
jgi:hypothetical protein